MNNGCYLIPNILRGPTGPIGPTGATGPQGNTGPTGMNGLAATVEVEKAIRVPFSDNPSVENIGTSQNAVLRFSIPAGMPGSKGEEGKSAYQVALDSGFIGTEKDWLESLKGPKGDKGEPSQIVSLKGLQVELLKVEDTKINPGELIVFDDIIFNNSTMTYESTTGEFKINKPGTYYISWIIAINNGNSSIAIALNGKPYSETTAQADQYTHLFGQALINITTTPTILTLINSGNDRLYFPIIDKSKANLVIFEIS